MLDEVNTNGLIWHLTMDRSRRKRGLRKGNKEKNYESRNHNNIADKTK